MRNSKGS